MKSLDQALSILEQFSEDTPELGLTELATVMGYDKAKTRRYLLGLIKKGLVEQDKSTKGYRLGPAILRLAKIKEETFPIEATVSPFIQGIVTEFEETAHLSLITGDTLSNIYIIESPKAHRVTMKKGEIIPLHATASGLAYLAALPGQEVESRLPKKLPGITGHTITSKKTLFAELEKIRSAGVARCDSSYEEGVKSLAVAILSPAHDPLGTIAIAAPAARVSASDENKMAEALKKVAKAIGNKLANLS